MQSYLQDTGLTSPGSGASPRRQPYPSTPSQHALVLHPVKARGTVTVGRKLPAPEDWSEDSFAPWELEAVLADAAGAEDVYLTQNRFRRGRRVVSQVRNLSALWADLDYYNLPELQNLTPESVYEMALQLLEKAGMPPPSLALSSGKGVYLVWLHSRLGRDYLPAWNSAIQGLYWLLKPLGADGQVCEAARVLRLAGTTNSKEGGGPVYALQDADEKVHKFEELGTVLIPKPDDEASPEEERKGADLYDLAVQRAARGYWSAPNGWSDASLWEGRLTDLQTLRRLRYGDGAVMENYRDRWLFIAATAISWLTPPAFLEREVVALAEEAAGWDKRLARRDLSTVLKRARRAAGGETITFAGREWDPRHHFRTETIIDDKWLGITPAEQREMVVTISPEEELRRKRLRDQTYQEKRRRAAGVPKRAQYRNNKTAVLEKNIASARHQKRCGRTNQQIASDMKVSVRTVQRWFA